MPGWPHGLDRCQIMRAAPGVTGARARTATPQAPLTPECGPPGHSGSQGMGSRCLPGGAGGQGRGGVPGRGGGCCRHCHSHIRGSGPQVCLRQDGAPDLDRESPWCPHHLRGSFLPRRASRHATGLGGSCRPLRRRSSRPRRTRPVAGDRDHGFRRGLPRRVPGARTGRAAAAAPSTTGPGSPGQRGLAAAQPRADRRGVPVGAGGLGQRGAHRSSRPGDMPAAGLLAGGVLGGDQPGVAHERPGGGEPAPVHHLGGQRQPAQLADAPVATQPGHRPGQRLAGRPRSSSASSAASSASRTSSAAR